MPTYQYKCPNCGNEFEEFQSITAAPQDKCPRCGHKPERLITGGAGFLFKGSGFYITDHRSDSYKKSAQKDADAARAKPADSSGGKKTEQKASKKAS